MECLRVEQRPVDRVFGSGKGCLAKRVNDRHSQDAMDGTLEGLAELRDQGRADGGVAIGAHGWGVAEQAGIGRHKVGQEVVLLSQVEIEGMNYSTPWTYVVCLVTPEAEQILDATQSSADFLVCRVFAAARTLANRPQRC